MIDPKLDELEEQEWCYYSDLPSPMAYMTATNSIGTLDKSSNSNTDSGTLDKSSSIDNNKDKKDDSSTLS